MSLRKEFADIAIKEVGVMEVSTNRSPRILEYRATTTLGVAGVPDQVWAWCSAFVCWVQKEFMATHMKELLGQRLRSAKADDWEHWKFPGLSQRGNLTLAKMGDIVTFQFNKDLTKATHVGIVVEDQKTIYSNIVTIEGNTSPGTAQRDGKRDGVYKMSRSPRLVRKYISWLP